MSPVSSLLRTLLNNGHTKNRKKCYSAVEIFRDKILHFRLEAKAESRAKEFVTQGFVRKVVLKLSNSELYLS